MKKVLLKTLKQLSIFLGGTVVAFGCMIAVFLPFSNPRWFIFSGIWTVLLYGGLFFYTNYVEAKGAIEE